MGMVLMSAQMLAASDVCADPAHNLKELGAQYHSCTQIKGWVGTEGSWVRVRFSVRSDGSLFGYPRIDNSSIAGTLDAQQAFRETAISAFAKCFPISVTPDFGAALAGKILRARISG